MPPGARGGGDGDRPVEVRFPGGAMRLDWYLEPDLKGLATWTGCARDCMDLVLKLSMEIAEQHPFEEWLQTPIASEAMKRVCSGQEDCLVFGPDSGFEFAKSSLDLGFSLDRLRETPGETMRLMGRPILGLFSMLGAQRFHPVCAGKRLAAQYVAWGTPMPVEHAVRASKDEIRVERWRGWESLEADEGTAKDRRR